MIITRPNGGSEKEYIYQCSDTNILATVISAEISVSATQGASGIIGIWTPEHDGMVRGYANLKTASDTTYAHCYGVSLDDILAIGMNWDTIGTLVSPGAYNTFVANANTVNLDNALGQSTSYAYDEFLINVKKGIPVVFLLGQTASSTAYSLYCNSLKIYGSIVEV